MRIWLDRGRPVDLVLDAGDTRVTTQTKKTPVSPAVVLPKQEERPNFLILYSLISVRLDACKVRVERILAGSARILSPLEALCILLVVNAPDRDTVCSHSRLPSLRAPLDCFY